MNPGTELFDHWLTCRVSLHDSRFEAVTTSVETVLDMNHSEIALSHFHDLSERYLEYTKYLSSTLFFLVTPLPTLPTTSMDTSSHCRVV